MKLAALALALAACTTPEYEPPCGAVADVRATCPGPTCADAWTDRLTCLADAGADLRVESCWADCDLTPTADPGCADRCR